MSVKATMNFTLCAQERKEEGEMKGCELVQQAAVASLSEGEKRAMAAERRMASQVPHSSTLSK